MNQTVKPNETSANRAASRPADCDVLVVGGGPIGLLLAGLLGERGIRTVVVERRHELPQESMAIGITPPALLILKKVGLDQVFSKAGLQVVAAEVLEENMRLGRLHFDTLPSEYPFWLSLPQSKTVEILWHNLTRYPSVSYCGGVEFLGLEQGSDGVRVALRQLDTGIEWNLLARYVAACDGHRSQVREAVAIPVNEKRYPQRFLMADFEDETDLGSEARLFFTPEASVESFPLPGGRRRWIVLTPDQVSDTRAYLLSVVRRLTGYDLSSSAQHYLSAFGAKRMEVTSYFKDRVALCGDAAHTMSSVGGQGMNTGFADAEMLAAVLEQILGNPAIAPEWLAFYDRIRRKAFRVAAARAARGMWLGTARGSVMSHFRKWFIKDILFGPWIKEKLAPHFSMLTIPFNNLTNTPDFLQHLNFSQRSKPTT